MLKKERYFFQQQVANIFGKNSLQLGLPNINLLHGNKINNHYILNLDIECNLNFLPFANNSLDLIICPHGLESYNDYKYILKELYRIITPNGKIIMTSFNHHSWLSLYKNKFEQLSSMNFIKLSKLKEEINNTGLQIIGGKFFSYCPPFDKASKFIKYDWLNKIGDRWFPTFANSFALILRKNIGNITLIKQNNLNRFNNVTEPIGAIKTWNKS